MNVKEALKILKYKQCFWHIILKLKNCSSNIGIKIYRIEKVVKSMQKLRLKNIYNLIYYQINNKNLPTKIKKFGRNNNLNRSYNK